MYTRRNFIKGLSIASAASLYSVTGLKKTYAQSQTPGIEKAIVIDITKCNGCKDKETADCVLACYYDNNHLYPEPIDDIADYWPQQRHEDWSDQINNRSRWTPYNWIFVQDVEVEINGSNQELHVVRLCMHCDNPQCQKLCPFGVIGKTKEGAVVIDLDLCLGGAKCRDVCPWEVPQRQAGVGVYLDFVPKFAGGGVMYKCDFCYHHIEEERLPRCVNACTEEGMYFGDKADMLTLAENRANEINGYIYGIKENGGTSVFYVSPVSFDEITEAINQNQPPHPTPFLPDMRTNVVNQLDTLEGYAWATLVAPVAGIAAGIGLGYKSLKKVTEEGQ